MRRLKNLLIVLLAAALVLLGCSSDDSGTAVTGQPAGIAIGGSDSIIPDLVPKEELQMAPADESHVAHAPEVPPPIDRTDQRIFEIHFEVIEGVCPLDPESGTDTLMWGFRVAGDDEVQCGSPGPVLRGRVGDLVRFTLTNLEGNEHPHNIDFHAFTGQGGAAEALTVGPGETATTETRLLYPGAFMYHCAFGDVPEHIARGMVGMFIVDPERPLPEVDHEWAVMQSEWYVGQTAGDGRAPFDRQALMVEEPRFVTFNGRTDALVGDNALRMEVGERARFYMVNEGLNLNSNFHPIGSHWDKVYPEAATHPDNDVIRGSQSTLVVAGGGTVTEMVGLVPSTVILVDHALVRTFYKGAIGHVVIEGEDAPEIFGEGDSGAGVPAGDPGSNGAGSTPTTEAATTTTEASGDGEAVTGNEVSIPAGAFNPANADEAYLPGDLTVPVGTTVTWTNEDSVAHTVTSGEVSGNVGSPDGIFDSGILQAGDTFTYTFEEPGEFPYYCTPHPWMQGTVTVES